jgi:hypothetical protein
MASSWYNTVVMQMNDMFTPGAKIKDTGKQFRQKHGRDGKGNDAGTVPYKFGVFAVGATDMTGKKAVPAGQEPRWLIDTGARHWDQSVPDIEAAVIDSLTRENAELQIVFIMAAVLPAGQPAHADVVRTTTGYTVTIYCAP